jgi:hypothetical protein
VSALIAGWFARLRETVVRDSLSRSAISCWLIGELMGKGACGLWRPLSRGARGEVSRQPFKIEQRGIPISSSKIVVHAELRQTNRVAKKCRKTEEEAPSGRRAGIYALGSAHED